MGDVYGTWVINQRIVSPSLGPLWWISRFHLMGDIHDTWVMGDVHGAWVMYKVVSGSWVM